ncbi:hypothetical protein R6Q59_033597 [Mikania micrantha]
MNIILNLSKRLQLGFSKNGGVQLRMQVHQHHQFMNNNHKKNNHEKNNHKKNRSTQTTNVVYTVNVFANGPFWTTNLKNGLQMCKNFILMETLHYVISHIQGWVGRMMNWRQRQQQKEEATDMRWSILPSQFYDYLVDSCTTNTVSFANGKSSSFPSFFDVDYVYFPFCVENNEWLLVQVELRNVNLVMYCSECFSSEKYRRAVHPKLMKISIYFCALLANIKYFKKNRLSSENDEF